MTLHRLDDFLVDRVAQPSAERFASRVGCGPHGQAWALRRMVQVLKVAFWALTMAFDLAHDVSATGQAIAAVTALCLAAWIVDRRLAWARRLQRDAQAEAAQADIWGRGQRGSRLDGFGQRWSIAAWLGVFLVIGAGIAITGGDGTELALLGLFVAANVLDLASRFLHACRPQPPGRALERQTGSFAPASQAT